MDLARIWFTFKSWITLEKLRKVKRLAEYYEFQLSNHSFLTDLREYLDIPEGTFDKPMRYVLQVSRLSGDRTSLSTAVPSLSGILDPNTSKTALTWTFSNQTSKLTCSEPLLNDNPDILLLSCWFKMYFCKCVFDYCSKALCNIQFIIIIISLSGKQPISFVEGRALLTEEQYTIYTTIRNVTGQIFCISDSKWARQISSLPGQPLGESVLPVCAIGSPAQWWAMMCCLNVAKANQE